jgi:hypothetical protein
MRRQALEAERLDRGDDRPNRCPVHLNEGVVDWLQSCTEKDSFVAIDSESTDTR